MGRRLLLLLITMIMPFAHADQPWSTSVDGRLFKGGTTTPLRDQMLVFTLQILNPARTCVLYEESQTYDTDVTNGFFNLKVGARAPDPTLKRTSNDPGFAMARIFNNTLNSFPSASNCPGGYTPADGDSRYLRVIVRPSAGGVETLSPDIALNSVPSAKVAETVGGLERSQILNVNMQGVNRVDMTNLESIFNSTQLPILNSLLAGTSGLYIQHAANNTISVPGVSGNASGASAGQIWYDTTSNQLKYQSNSGPQTLGVAGAGISSVTAGTGLNVGAGPGGSITTAGTLNVNVGTGDGQIVQVQTGGKLPALNASDLTNVNGSAIQSGTIGGTTALNTSGNLTTTGTLTSGAITSTGNIAGANLTATNSVTANDARLNALRVYKPSTSNYVEFVADSALSAPVVLTLPTALGTNGQVLQTDNTGKLSWVSISNTPGGSAGGDLGGNYPNPSVNAVRGNPVATGTLAVGDTGKVYRWSGTQFEAVNFGVDDLRTEAGLQQFATNCGADQTLTWSTITDAFACTTIGIAGTQITSGTINAARLPTIDPTKGGTGLTSIGTSNQLLGVNNAGSAMEYKSITGGAGVTITHSAGGIQVSATGSGGTVTNVTGSAPISVTNNNSTPAITISQASNTTDGYLSSTDWNTFNSKQAAGNYLTGLTGDVVATGPGSVAATIQANAITTGKINNLAVTDAKINDVAWSKITGVPALLSAVNTAGTSNQVFGMNAAGTAGEYKSITGGSGVTITHSVNGIEVSATGSGGTVTGVTAGTGLNVGAGPGGTINGSGTLNIDVGTTTGKIVQVAAGNKLPAIDGSDLTNLNASNLASGTVPTARLPVVPIANGGTGQTTANAALNALLPSQALNSGKVLQTNGTDTSWVTPNAGTVTNVTVTSPLSVSTGSTTPALSISQASTSTPGYLSAADWNTFNSKAAATDLNNYVLKAGDTMTGALTLPSNGLVVGTDQLVVSGAKVGIGTASPGGLLHVLSSSDPSAKIESSGASSTLDITSTTNRTLRFRQSAGTIAQITNAGASIFLDYNGANNGGRFGVRNGLGGTEMLTLLSSGSVGIGTTSPQGRLHIAGGAANTTALMTAGAGYNAGFSFGDTANGTRWKVEKNNTAEGGSNAGSDLVVSSWDDAGAYLAIPFMIKRSNGNVGINTQTPGEKLEVVGKIKGTELCIGTDCRAAWPTGAGGTVTSVTSANADIGVATTTTTPVLTLNTGTGANQIVKLNGSSELPAVSGANLTNLNASNLASGTIPAARLPAFTGDVTSSAGSATLTLGTVPVGKGGTGATSFGANKLVSTNGTGSALVDWFCPDGQFVKFTAGVVGCDTLTNILGYTPANGTNYVAKAGDTMTGALNLPSNGLAVGTNQFVMSGGNIGIGTASPDNILTIEKSANSVVWQRMRNSNAGSSASIGILFGGDGSTGQSAIVQNSNANSALGGIGSLNIGNYGAAGVGFFTNGVQRALIDYQGQVGIGTTGPGRKLDVNGTIASTGSDAPYTSNAWIRNFEASHGGAIVWPIGAGDRSWGIGKSNNPSKFFIFNSTVNDNSAAANYVMTMENSGNVGIGTTSPNVTLDLGSKTDALRLPAGTTAQRPGSSANGDLRYNSTSSQMEAYVAGSWTSLLTTGQSRGFSVYNSVHVGTGTVNWAGVLYNDGNYTPANGRYTATVSGLYYLCTSGISYSLATYARWYIQINGVNKSTECRTGAVGGDYGSCGVCTTAFMNAGDYATVNVTNDGIYSGYGGFSGVMISGSTVASGGSGTANYIPQWTSSTALGNSPIAVSGSNVGVGTISPGVKLDVSGTVRANVAEGSNALSLLNSANGGSWNFRLQGDGSTANNFYLDSTNLGGNALTIRSNGNIGIGTTAPTQKLHVYGTAKIDSIMGGEINGAGNFHLDARGGGATYLNWSSGSGGVYIMNGAMGYGSIYAGAFTVNSDKTLKKNIEPIKNSLDLVNQMNGVKFNWINPKESPDRQVGVIAQDVQKVLPELVTTNKETGRLAVNYPALVAPLIEAVKELYQKLTGTQTEVAAMKRELANVKDEVKTLSEQNKALKALVCLDHPKADVCKK